MNFNFLQSEWTYAAGTLFFMVVAWKIDNYRKGVEKKEDLKSDKLDRLIDVNNRLKSEFRQNWARIASYPEDNKQIFKQDIRDLKSDELRVCIYHIIDILTDVFANYEEKGFNIDKSNWKKTFIHVFNPHEMTVVVTAYEKYKKEGQFSEDFVDYVDLIINHHKSNLNK